MPEHHQQYNITPTSRNLFKKSLIRVLIFTGITAVLFSTLRSPAVAYAQSTPIPSNVVTGIGSLANGLAQVDVTYDAVDPGSVRTSSHYYMQNY